MKQILEFFTFLLCNLGLHKWRNEWCSDGKGNSGNGFPRKLEPVLVKISALNDLGTTIYHEVVYHDGDNWCSYAGSKTFEDGEQVKKWVYVNDII